MIRPIATIKSTYTASAYSGNTPTDVDFSDGTCGPPNRRRKAFKADWIRLIGPGGGGAGGGGAEYKQGTAEFSGWYGFAGGGAGRGGQGGNSFYTNDVVIGTSFSDGGLAGIRLGIATGGAGGSAGSNGAYDTASNGTNGTSAATSFTYANYCQCGDYTVAAFPSTSGSSGGGNGLGGVAGSVDAGNVSGLTAGTIGGINTSANSNAGSPTSGASATANYTMTYQTTGGAGGGASTGSTPTNVNTWLVAAGLAAVSCGKGGNGGKGGSAMVCGTGAGFYNFFSTSPDAGLTGNPGFATVQLSWRIIK